MSPPAAGAVKKKQKKLVVENAQFHKTLHSRLSTLDSLTEDEQFPLLTKIDADMYCSSMVKRKERQKKKKKERHTVSGTDEGAEHWRSSRTPNQTVSGVWLQSLCSS